MNDKRIYELGRDGWYGMVTNEADVSAVPASNSGSSYIPFS